MNLKHNTMMFYLLLLLLEIQLLVLLPCPTLSSSSQDAPPIAKPGCRDHCGEVRIPYPFGIGANCFRNESYEISCDTSFGHSKPFLKHFNLEVMEINWSGRYPYSWSDEEGENLLKVRAPAINICRSDGAHAVPSIDFGGSPYRFSTWYNTFVVEGCGGDVLVKDRKGKILTGCASVCPNDNGNIETTDCYGVGCCKASFLSSPEGDASVIFEEKQGLDMYQLVLDDHEGVLSSRACNMVAVLIESQSLYEFAGKLSNLSTLPAVLEWRTTHLPTRLVNVSCDEPDEGQCYCGYPYYGNPYLPYGCQAIRECRKCRDYHCTAKVKGSSIRYYCENPFLQRGPIIGFSVSMGTVILLLSCYWLYRVIKRKQEAKRKAKYFKRNGGLLLQQQVSSSEGIFESTKLFRISELEKATNKFNKNRILGQGGQGTVYKGMLTDGRIVAIKKSKQVDESQLEQFINEVVILSQINHRNVVKLRGCCLETEVPLLVYEFITNGTLYEHIHDSSNDFHVTWKMRLQIAAESAEAVAYLHSSSSTPIYHRDIKSSNILLDNKYRAKVSDFGTSRAITIEQTHVTTCVLGTYGYLDPEYFQSHMFTEKSDVYSFGVVLVELITGKKPICPTKSGGWISLASEFLLHMEGSLLFDIVDKRILEEGKEEEFIAVADLAKRCLDMNGKQRPTMREIAVLLDGIRSSREPNSKESNCMESKCVDMVLNDMHSAPFSSNMLFSDEGPGSSNSSEGLPLMANTI